MNRLKYLLTTLFVCHLSLLTGAAQPLSERYNEARPVVVVGDWDKPPYEFLNDKGEPAGTNIDVLRTILEKQMGLHVRFVLKEWGNALKTFERGDADLILANVRRYSKEPYYATQNIINYNRIRAASMGDSATIIPIKKLMEEGVVLKNADYTTFFFRSEDSLAQTKVEYLSPKVALMGLINGDNKYFIWGEEPLKWKIKELNLEHIVLNEVSIPVSEIHIIGRDRNLIYEIDDYYSRLKQSGEVERINNSWLHPERNTGNSTTPQLIYLTLLAVLLAFVLFLLTRLAHNRVLQATRQSTDLNNMMIKALHMGNFHVTEYDIANDRMTNSYGAILPPSGLTFDEFSSRIHPDEQEEFSKKMKLVLTGRSRKFELKKRWNAGTEEQPNWLTFNGHVIVELNNEEQPAYVINAIHDVTNNMEDDRTARELVNKYERLRNMSFAAMSFYDKDGWLIDLNDAMREMCGMTADDADTERFWQTSCMFDIPLFRNVYSPDDHEDLLVCQHMEYPDIGLDNYIEFHVRPLFDEKGELANYFISALNLTEERQRDREMHIQHQDIRRKDKLIDQYEWKLRYMLQNSKAYIWKTDFKERYIEYSQSLREAYERQSFPEYLDSIHNDQRVEISDLLDHPGKLNETYTYMVHFRKAPYGSNEQWDFISGKINYDDEGHAIGHVGLARDISQLVQARQLLEEETQRAKVSGQQKSMFLASMTHELRTPLNSIVGFSDLLGSVTDPQERQEMIRIIRSNCDMLLRLINDILEASNISDGPDSITMGDVDFAQAFDDICQAMEQRVQQAGVEFIKLNPYQSYPTRLDIGRIQQVITNFVTNAVKYTVKGHIKVGYRQEDNGLYIFCEDTGAGIPKEKQASVFERFVKLNEFVQGTGLGLAICKSIAERHGGRIGLTSEGEGHGSTFWIWIPCTLRK